MPIKSSRLFTFEESTCLFTMYLAMKFSKSLIFLASNAMYSIDPWREIRWKLPSHSSDSIGVLESYRS